MTKAPLALVSLCALAVGCASASAPRDVDVSNEPGAQFETRVAVDPANPRVLVAAAMGQGPWSAHLHMHVYSSRDGGRSWSAVALPAIPGDCAWDPTVAIGPDHHQYFAYSRFVHCRRIPQYAGVVGRAAIYLATRASSTSPWREAHRPVVALHGTRADDRPALAVDLKRNRLYLGWVDYQNYDAPLEVVHSEDDGRTWSRPVAASTPGIRTATSLAVGPHGELYAGWEDAGGLRIMVSRSTDGGHSFEPARLVANAVEDGGLCGSAIPAQGAHQQGLGCVRPIPSLAVGKDGRLYDVWAMAGDNGSQDVFVAVMDAALRPLGPPRRVNPHDGRRPSDQFLPAVAVDAASGRLWICYYDTSGDPRRIRTHYTCTWSDDDGKHFAKPQRVASVASDERQPGASFYGDYAGLAAAGGVAHPIWTDTRRLKRLGEEVYTAALR